jgi:hypothetical protein
MAAIRIKDLTTTASSTASDDFIAVDGTTNGTRKLSAFSPTCGGNATVTGTLTVNGGGVFTRANTGALAIKSGDAGSYTDISLGRTAAEHFLAIAGSANNYVAGTVAGDCALNASSATAAIFVGVYGNAIGKFTSSGLSIPTTTASTTTSTGALVVGNGTSGGLGVGGAVNIGGTLTVGSNLTVSGNIASVGASGSGTGGGVRLVDDGGTSRWLAGLLGTAGARDYVIYDSVTPRQVIGISATTGVVSLSGNTASTDTASGALVITGGLGAGGAINVGTFYGMVDGVTAPGTTSGYAKIYVDSADGDLKVKFGDGTVKTIATDS